jgi:hypothetical protein
VAYYDLRNEYQYQRLYRFFEDEFENERFRSPDIDFDNTEPTDISVQIWSDSDHVADAASFLIQVDQDLRWAAGSLLTVTRRLRRLRTLGLPWVIAAAYEIPPQVGGLRILRSERSGSLATDCEVVGALAGAISAAPIMISTMRTVLRRLPFRIRIFRPEGSGRELGLIDADLGAEPPSERTPKTRQIVRHPDGTEIITETF